MLKKLRRRFIAVIMAVAIISTVTILVTNIISTERYLKQQSSSFLQTLMSTNTFFFRPGETDSIQVPYFIAYVDSKGEITLERSGYFTLDEDFLLDVISKAYYSETEAGTLEEYSLDYLMRSEFGGYRIAFVDTSARDSTLKSLRVSSVIIGFVAAAVFFVFSLLISKAIVKPTAKAWERQKQFIADASHELKTPLTVIMANSELLQESNSEMSEDDRKHIDNILSEGLQMRSLIEDLLDQAKADAGESRIVFDNVDLSYLVQESAMMFDTVIFENGRSLSYDDVEDDIKIEGDSKLLGRLVTILLDNANKYSDAGTEIKLSLKTDGKKNAVLKVSDFGSPITPEQAKNIFNRFYRADEAREHNGSFGLGLSIAKTICESHRGSIKAECNGNETVFTAVIPMVQPKKK